MAAKRAPKRAQADPPANESCGSAASTTDGEVTMTLASPPQPAGAEQQAAHNTSDELRRIQLRADIVVRIFRELTKCVKDKHKNVRVLGVITWGLLLALPASLAVGLIVLVFRWDPAHTIWLLTGSTGVVASTNLVNRILRRRR
jgi:hypothetical protein